MQIQTCEICGKTFIAEYGYSLVINWVVTGHHVVPNFLCKQAGPSGQHWGHSPEHAYQAALRCLQNHMHVDELLSRHQSTEKPRYAPEHENWAKDGGEEFHIVQIIGGPK